MTEGLQQGAGAAMRQEAARPAIAVVVPVLADDAALAGLLPQLTRLAQQVALELVVVDGAGHNSTRKLVEPYGRYLPATPSRGGQIRAGIAISTAGWVWLLHADAQLNDQVISYLVDLTSGPDCWGRFDVDLAGLAMVAAMMNWRSRLTKICTGDQGMFFSRSLLCRAGGFPDQPLMEDIEVSRRLKRVAPGSFRAPRIRIGASARRWRRRGVARTILSMWRLRLQYWLGAAPEKLYRRYYGTAPARCGEK